MKLIHKHYYYRMMIIGMVRSPSTRTVWSKPRSTHWWDSVKAGLYGDEWWKENLRMSKQTFDTVCMKLRTRMRSPVGVDKRVAVTLWRLATK